MKTKEEIEQEINEILSDERLSYKTAVVFTNAPLALVQFALETKLHTLQWVIGVERTDIKKLRGEK